MFDGNNSPPPADAREELPFLLASGRDLYSGGPNLMRNFNISQGCQIV